MILDYLEDARRHQNDREFAIKRAAREGRPFPFWVASGAEKILYEQYLAVPPCAN